MSHRSSVDAVAVGPREPLTVRRLLDEPPLAAARLIMGEGGLDQRISWCLPWCEAVVGDRLDGVAVFARTEALGEASAVDRLHELVRRGMACLLVVGNAADVDERVVDAAVGIPVLQLPPTATFLTVSRLVAKQNLAREARNLEYGVTVHRTLGELLYRGAGLGAFSRELSRLTRCPALIVDPQGKLLAHEYLGTDKRTAEAPDPAAVLYGLRAGPLCAPPAEDDSAATHTEVVRLELEGTMVTCVVTPIVLGRVRYGWIVLVELAQPPPRHDVVQHQIIADQAVTIIGSEMLRLRSVEEAEERARGDFVHALLHGRFAARHDLLARAAHHEFDVDASYGVVVARGLETEVGGQALDRMLSLARHAQRILPRRGARTLATVVGDVLVVIRQVTPREDGNEQVAAYAHSLSADLSARTGRPLTVTYGRPASDAHGIPGSYREARVALSVCERLGVRRVSGYPELRVFAVLADISGSPQGVAFAREVLAPLRRREVAASQLEAAVIGYVECGGNLNAAARQLSLHRNTMLYKLERASRLLGMDLREAENRFTMWLAYRIDMLGEVQSSLDAELEPGA